MLVEKLSRIFGKEEKENERVEELHQRLAERLGKEERDWVLELIDEKDRERLEAQEENFRRGFKLGLRLGREIFQCEDEPHCFRGWRAGSWDRARAGRQGRARADAIHSIDSDNSA